LKHGLASEQDLYIVPKIAGISNFDFKTAIAIACDSPAKKKAEEVN